MPEEKLSPIRWSQFVTTSPFSSNKLPTPASPRAFDESVIHAEVIWQQKHRPRRQFFSVATVVKTPGIRIPVVEKPVLHRQHFSIHEMPALAALKCVVNVLRSSSSERHNIQPMAISMRPAQPVQRKAVERGHRIFMPAGPGPH